jgi:hypothetical protein
MFDDVLVRARHVAEDAPSVGPKEYQEALAQR